MINKVLLVLVILILLVLLGWCSPQCSKQSDTGSANDSVGEITEDLNKTINTVQNTSSDSMDVVKPSVSSNRPIITNEGASSVTSNIELAKNVKATVSDNVDTSDATTLTGTTGEVASTVITTIKNSVDAITDSAKKLGGSTHAKSNITEAVTETITPKAAMGVATNTVAGRISAAVKSAESGHDGGQTKVVLEGVNFRTNSDQLTDISMTTLKKVVNSLSTKSTMNVEIAGYTDNIGDSAYNIELSQRRAKSVVNFLVNSGISASRLTHKGYGAVSPLADNNTVEGRLRNRRVEMHVK